MAPPPLLGIVLTSQVNGQTNFLYDGRARIVCHGGEARGLRNALFVFDQAQEEALVRYARPLFRKL